MKEFTDAIAKLQTGDILRLLLILGPVLAAAWAAINWAYKTRLAQLEKSLELVRADRELELKRLREQLEIDKIQAITGLQAEIKNVNAEHAEATVRLRELRHTLAELYGKIGPDRAGPGLGHLLDHVRDNYWTPVEMQRRRKEAHRLGVPLIEMVGKPPTGDV
jgi:hypothetical protein